MSDEHHVTLTTGATHTVASCAVCGKTHRHQNSTGRVAFSSFIREHLHGSPLPEAGEMEEVDEETETGETVKVSRKKSKKGGKR